MSRGSWVFVGGYFYDPFFGPYPWWPRAGTWYGYYPVFDRRAELKLQVTPRDAAVYVDGFYAGIVDDFDGLFQALPLPPGGHEVVLYLQGFRTARYNLYLHAGATFRVRHTMEPVVPGTSSEPPPSSALVPPPPAGSYKPPRTPPPASLPPAASPGSSSAASSAMQGVLEMRVQPANAIVAIDGQRWISSAEGVYEIEVPAGRRRVEVSLQGYQTLATEVDVRADEVSTLNVSLSR